jgi:hypothetical protein
MTKKKILAIAILFGSFASCHKAHTYEATVELTRITSIRKDEQGATLTEDVEFSYFECPGTQIEVIRGGKDFASCMSQHKVGDKVKVKLEHKWDPEGFYDYDVFEVQGCKRPPDPNDEASYKMVRECNDWNVNGTRVGFQCNYSSKKELNKKCPWFQKR